jgi:HAD superfamily hydrolase (TIGR01544 family)
MKHIFYKNKEYEKLRKVLIDEGSDKLHIVSDFDKTLTYAKTKDGKPLLSIILILRDYGYISSEYQTKAKELFEKYHPIEINCDIPLQEKKKAMKEWWTKHFELLISSGLNIRDLEKIVRGNEIRLREGFSELVGLLKGKKIPMIILSANGVGNTIPMILEREGLLYENISIITNIFQFDEQGKAIGVSQPIIHSLNKDEAELRSFPIYRELKSRRNIILLGDGLNDVEMLKGFEYDRCLKIGFLKEGANEKEVEAFRKVYDVLLNEDSDLSFVNKLIEEIIK